MKRERKHNATHHFSFGERFDEMPMKTYYSVRQYISSSIHHFIGFSPLNKSAGKMAEVNTAIRRLVGRTSILPTDRKSPYRWRKEKGNRKQPTSPPTSPQAFGKQKAIAH